MKPALFSYHKATSVEDALDFLRQNSGDVKILAGGQSLVPMMNFRLARPSQVLDLNGLSDLSQIRVGASEIRVGALTRHAMIEDDPRVRAACPLMSDAVAQVGHRAIRNRGTVGGSLAHADPAAEWPAVLSALGGTVKIQGAGGSRTLTAAEFFVDYLMTALQPEEMITEAVFPTLPSGAGWSFQEVARRPGDFALVGAATWVLLDRNQALVDGSFALTGVGAGPVNGKAALLAAKGSRLDPERIQELAGAFARTLEPESDLHASADFRRHLAEVLIGRTLREATERAVALSKG